VVWNPSASSCFFKIAGATAFAKAGDVTCCPPGTTGCPSAPGPGWRLLSDFSDEFPVSNTGAAMVPLNQTRWSTNESSWSPYWSWVF